MPAYRDCLEFVKAVSRMTTSDEHWPSDGADDFVATLNRLIEEARTMVGLEPVTVDEKWIAWAEEHGAEFTAPQRAKGYWYVFDANEESWRVDASDVCTTKADAARAYCEFEGCGEPDGVDPEDIDTRAE